MGKISSEINIRTWLAVALFVFSASFFLVESSKIKNNIFYICIAAPMLFYLIGDLRKNILFKNNSLYLLITFFALSAIIDIFLWRADAFSLLKHSLYLIAFYMALSVVRGGAEFETFWARCWGGLGAGFLVLAAILWGYNFISNGNITRLRLFGAAENPVYAALMISSCIITLWIFGIEKKIKQNKIKYYSAFAFFSILICMISIFFQARSALVGSLCAILLMLILEGRNIKLFLLLAVIMLIVFYVGGGYEVILKRGGSHRLDIWTEAVDRVVNKCGVLSGCGDDNYRFIGKYYHPHNSYLSIFYRVGIIPFLSFVCWAIYYIYNSIIYKSKWFYVSLVGWGGLLTTGSGPITSPQPFWIYFWLPVFLSILEVEQLRRLKSPATA